MDFSRLSKTLQKAVNAVFKCEVQSNLRIPSGTSLLMHDCCIRAVKFQELQEFLFHRLFRLSSFKNGWLIKISQTFVHIFFYKKDIHIQTHFAREECSSLIDGIVVDFIQKPVVRNAPFSSLDAALLLVSTKEAFISVLSPLT